MIIHVDNATRGSLWRLTRDDVRYGWNGEDNPNITFLVVLQQCGIVRCSFTPYFRFIALDDMGKMGIFDLYCCNALNLEEFEHGKVQGNRHRGDKGSS